MTAPKERTIGLAQFLTISAVALVVLIGWDFGHRVLDTMSLAQKDAQATIRLQAAQQINQQLKDLKGRAVTDAYAEWFVRNYRHWTRENETLFVPIATPVPVPTAAPPPAPAPTPRPEWQQWLDSLINAIFGPAS